LNYEIAEAMAWESLYLKIISNPPITQEKQEYAQEKPV
jgi:16S rRNA G1207 methylase RsmC